LDARALISGLADLAGVVRGEERADDKLAGFDSGYGAPDRFDDTGVFVTHRCWLVDLFDAAVGP
jgi:hypothetical protein